ncbi:MAG: Gfo/Idh/MocA family oxidoreductase [Clostridia bacterium]|nr:Gfo/Idh/MocA family oxidoreductase [Clostridia bacterium]
MITYGIVGAGWRAWFYIRLASLLPDRFALAGVVVRNPETRRKMAGVPFPVFETADELLARKPDFVVCAVNKASMASVSLALAEKGAAVLAETPLGADEDDQERFFARFRPDYRIQVAEQYHFQPYFAAVRALLDEGCLGDVRQVYLSACHDYHAVSLARFFLGTGGEFPEVDVFHLPDPVFQYAGRGGMLPEPVLNDGKSKLALLRFRDKSFLYDFCQTQYFSRIRGNLLRIRGSLGELTGDRAVILKNGVPVTRELTRNAYGANGDLEGLYLSEIVSGGKVLYKNPFPGVRLTDEEIAIATCLVKMGAYAGGGEPFYSVEEAALDAKIAMRMA